MRPYEEPCLLGWSFIIRVSATGSRGWGRGSLCYERGLAALHLLKQVGRSKWGIHFLLIIVPWQWCRNTSEKGQCWHNPRFCMLHINTFRLGKCPLFLQLCSLEQLFKDSINEEIFRQCSLSSEKEL